VCFPITNRDGIVAYTAHFIPNTFLTQAGAKVTSLYAVTRIEDNVWIWAGFNQTYEAGGSVGGQPVMKVIGMDDPPATH
jgi:hypothetical protein